MPYEDVIHSLRKTRNEFSTKSLHFFGIGGTATLHLAALLDIDSVDSTGWRNRAARGIVQLPGMGDRIAAELGNWRGRRVSEDEWELLAETPVVKKFGMEKLKASNIDGFCTRATHNLWVLFNEIRLIKSH